MCKHSVLSDKSKSLESQANATMAETHADSHYHTTFIHFNF
ncbi:hypothetical protein [Helicobacter cinaedi]|nr:hypothetical protein [Helicobacter cinaedi]